MKDRFGLLKSVEQRIAPRVLGEIDRPPADLLHRVVKHSGAKRFGDQLRTQTDTQDWLVLRYCLCNVMEFLPDVEDLVVSRHGPAHENQGSGIGDRNSSARGPEEIGVFKINRVASQHIRNQTERFERNVAKRENRTQLLLNRVRLRHLEMAQCLRVPGHAAIKRFGQTLPVFGFFQERFILGVAEKANLREH